MFWKSFGFGLRYDMMFFVSERVGSYKKAKKLLLLTALRFCTYMFISCHNKCENPTF